MPEEKDFKKAYSELQKKFNVPDIEYIDSEFEISTIEADKFLLREIRRKIHDKIDTVCKVLDGILQPEPVWHSMYESGIFTDDEKKGLYLIYKELMTYNRASSVLELEANDKLNAKFISEFTNKWKSMKEKLVDVMKKMEEGWKKEASMDEKLGYFG